MDTRNKIVNGEEFSAPPPIAVVTGTFDPFLPSHARDLEKVRGRFHQATLVVVVFASRQSILPARARAELVAAVRVVDYVVTAAREDVGQLIDLWQPAEVVRLEGEHERRTRQLIEHVRSRQSR